MVGFGLLRGRRRFRGRRGCRHDIGGALWWHLRGPDRSCNAHRRSCCWFVRRCPHLEDDLHVVRRALAADPPVQVVRRGRGYEVVILSRCELQTTGLRRKRPEGDREVHQLEGFIADGDYPGVRIRDPARVELILGHVVYDVLLHLVLLRLGHVHRADQVYLVVLKLCVILVYVDHVVRIVDAKDRVRGVPMDYVLLGAVWHHRRASSEPQTDHHDPSQSHTTTTLPTHCT